jgi:glycosyltransferase XagB
MGFEFTAVAQPRKSQGVACSLAHDPMDLHIEDWPTVSDDWLKDAMQRFSPQERERLLRQKIVPYSWVPGHTVHAVVHQGALSECRRLGINTLGRVPVETYRKLVRDFLSPRLLQNAVYGLARTKPWASARHRLSAAQSCVFSLLLLSVFVATISLPFFYVLNVLQIFSGLFFLMVVVLRCLCLMPLPKGPPTIAPLLSDQELPVYTVLVPVFREIEVINQLIHALQMLSYPVEKLDIKIILEEEDRPMHVAVKNLNLPWYFDVIIVPTGKPQTKPRALNYAMQFARGSLLTIFDSEDIPQPNQLRLAAAQFACGDESLACLQASLDFYNPAENWLTRQFAAEYAALFHVVLPTLAAYGLPMPLGGTSNHFRVAALNSVGGWDPYNVTEDADLGIRLARYGFKAGIIHSTTYEEANSILGNWMKQRRRWLKGFLQTWLVHNRNPVLLINETGVSGFCAIQAMTLGVFASALLHPFLLIFAIWNLLPAQLAETTTTIGGSLISGFSLAVLLAGYVSAIGACKKGLRRIRIFGWTSVLLTIPAYWLLVSVAAWLAIWDFAIAPFHWHKTRHGLSRVDRAIDRSKGFTSNLAPK